MNWKCRFNWHDWEEWKVTKRGDLFESEDKTKIPVGRYIEQTRTCKDCKLVQMRSTKV